MNLTFLNPLFLFGLAAGIFPILIHRLTKRKAIPRKFSAVRLLLKSQQVMARPQRLKHLFLLALRVLAVLSLAFMMARPVLLKPGLLAMGSGGAKVVILDNSLSMGYREENGERFEIAKKAAKEIIEGLEGQVIIIPTASSQGMPMQERDIGWTGPEKAVRELAETSLSCGRGNPTSALALAYRKLRDFKMSKEILFITDMARGDWEGFNLSKLGIIPSDVGLTLLRIGGPNRDSNLAVKGVMLADGEAVVGVPCRLEVAVSNLSDQSRSTLVQVYLSGIKVGQKTLELKAGEEGREYFELFLDRPGWLDGEVKLSGDRLPLDDIFYFPLKVREKVKVLVVDGDPRTSLKTSESYYLLNALHPGGFEGSPFLARLITEEELIAFDPSPYEGVFLLNVAHPQASKLSSILDSGKTIFIFLGDRVVPEKYNSFPFIPWRIREIKGEDNQKPEHITLIDNRHEALKPFFGTGGESLRSASFRRYFKIEGSTKNLLALGNKDPLLVEADLRGIKLFLFASSADLDWNDLPLKAAYLPLIQGLLKETTGLARDLFPAGIRFGDPFEEKGQLTQVAGAQGGPGIYKFLLQSGELRRGVNPPLAESNLTKLAGDEIRKMFGPIDMKVVEYREGALSSLQGGKRELWPFLLTFILIVLGVEMGVANKI